MEKTYEHNLDFNNLLKSLGKEWSSSDILKFIHQEISLDDNSINIHEPFPEDIIDESDNWKCIEMYRYGVVIEVFNEKIFVISFSSGHPIYNYKDQFSMYSKKIDFDFDINSHRDSVIKDLGLPKWSSELYDGYIYKDDYILSFLYNQETGKISMLNIALNPSTQNSTRIPSRISLIFDSLFDVNHFTSNLSLKDS